MLKLVEGWQSCFVLAGSLERYSVLVGMDEEGASILLDTLERAIRDKELLIRELQEQGRGRNLLERSGMLPRPAVAHRLELLERSLSVLRSLVQQLQQEFAGGDPS